LSKKYVEIIMICNINNFDKLKFVELNNVFHLRVEIGISLFNTEHPNRYAQQGIIRLGCELFDFGQDYYESKARK